jgi:protein-S-isoprenylcysteine O-methyltransferase Ste14
VHDLSLLLAMATAYHWTPFMAWTGIGLIALGLAVQTWSKGVLTRNRKLMDCGPYSICRHPFYLGNAIFDLGVCTMSGNLWLVAAYPVIFAIGYRFTFRMEETLLHSIHGQAHDEFRATTPMILPNPAGFVRRWRAPFSWRALLVERQVSRSIRLLSFPLLVLVSARAWQQPASLLSSATWTLLAVALALHTMRRFVYTQFEKRQTAVRSDARTPVWSHLALPAAAILPPLLVLFLEHDADDVVLMGLFSAALVGFRLVVEAARSPGAPKGFR